MVSVIVEFGLYKIRFLVNLVLFVVFIIFKMYEYIFGFEGVWWNDLVFMFSWNVFLVCYGLGLVRLGCIFLLGFNKNFWMEKLWILDILFDYLF